MRYCTYDTECKAILNSYMLSEENKQLKALIEKLKNHQNCKHRMIWITADIMDDELKSPCDKCKDYDKWELAE